MKKSGLKLSELSDAEASLLKARLRAARAAVTHSGEKGRTLEMEARSFFRSFLPQQFGLTTGFVVYHGPQGPRLSKQLDLIIYDALRGGPLVSLATCDVLPIESVYGYVEVKAQIRSGARGADALEQCLRDNAVLRQMRERRYWSTWGGSPTQTTPHSQHWLAVRAYIFAFETSKTLQPASRLAQRLATAARKAHDAHIHGIYSPDSGFAYMRAIDPATARPADWHHALATSSHASLAFKSKVLKDLVSFPTVSDEYLPAVEEYFDFVPVIEKFVPEVDAD